MRKSFFSSFSHGLNAWSRAFGFIRKNGLTHFYIYPILLAVVLGMGAFALIHQLVDYALDYISPYLEIPSNTGGDYWEKIKYFLGALSTFAVALALYLAAFFSYLKISKYLVLAIMSPLMSILSEKCGNILTGEYLPFDGLQWFKDIVRGIALSIRNVFVELFLLWSLFALDILLSIVFPPAAAIVSPIIAVVTFCVGAYFYGFSVLDYNFERRKYSLNDSVSTIRSMKGEAVGVGILFQLVMYIPVLGPAIGTVTGTVAAALVVHDLEMEKR